MHYQEKKMMLSKKKNAIVYNMHPNFRAVNMETTCVLEYNNNNKLVLVDVSSCF